MGGTSCKGSPNSNRVITIAILGLDNAGKTTTTRALEKEPLDSVAPTIGFSQSEIVHKNQKIKLIDLGGAKTFREAWRHYYDDAYGFVYVLDSSEEGRLAENRDVLKRLLQEEKVKKKPILILANKQDKAEALDKNAILEDLKIERLVNENQTLCRVELCTAKSLDQNGKNSAIDAPLRHGFDWLIKTICENYETLHKRVDSDVQNRRESEQKEKSERQERMKKLREENEKEDADNVDEDTMKRGFVPIGQAVKNAERTVSEKPKALKSKAEYELDRPVPAPRNSSRSRTNGDEEANDDDDERPRRRQSRDSLPPTNESTVPRSASSQFDDRDTANSNDEQTPTRSSAGKKKKLVGPGRSRLNGDNLPPLAPSSSASRREDFPTTKGPQVGTPRPLPLVAPWAITSPSPLSTTEQLTTITSDNEIDDDRAKHRSMPSTKRTVSPHPVTKNRIKDDDDANAYGDIAKKSNSQERERRSSKQRDEGDSRKASSRQAPSPSRRTAGSKRLPTKAQRSDDDDDDDR